MRNAIFAVALFVCVPAWAQTALPPQWGTSGNAAPTPKGKAGETKKPVKVKPGKGTVTPPAQEAPAPGQPVAPGNPGPAPPASAPAPPPPFIPPPAKTVAAPPPAAVPAPSPPPAADPAPPPAATLAPEKPPHKTATATAKPIARKKTKTADAALSTPAKPKPAALVPDTSAAPAPVAKTAPAAVAASPSAATYPTPAAPSSAPTYVAPAFVPPPVTNYPAPAAPAPAAANANPAYAAPARSMANPNPTIAAAAATYAPPSAASAVPLPGAAAPPAPPPAPQPLPSLVASSPRNRRKAAARDAALTVSREWIDISAPLSIGVTPAYPGTAPLAMRFDYDMDNGAPLDLSEFSMSMHTGTHVDAPSHFLRGAPAIDQIPLEQLCGPALVLNIDPSVTVITAADLERYPWRGARRILFRTRNSVNEWIVDPQFHPDYVWLAPDAAELLVSGGVELVGIDYLSIEQYGAPPRTQVILLSKGIAVVEGLDLRSVSAGEYDLTVLPLKILGHEAAPARAVLRHR